MSSLDFPFFFSSSHLISFLDDLYSHLPMDH
jgi:hypothetical protein